MMNKTPTGCNEEPGLMPYGPCNWGTVLASKILKGIEILSLWRPLVEGGNIMGFEASETWS